MAAKPTHVRAIAERLVEGADTPEVLAKDLINLVDTLREDDVTYTVVCQYGENDVQQPFYLAYGPYPTRANAVKALEQGRVGISGYGKRAVVPVYTPAHILKRFDSVDALDHLPLGWLRVRENVSP